MKTVIINGTNHKGSTNRVARILADKIGGEIVEFFLPHDFDEFCLGCTKCFVDSETKCSHHEKLSKITREIDSSDVIILASPVYAYHATGSMKVFLDHCAYRWMSHRPEESAFKKQAVCIATAAGAGMKSTIKDMEDSLFFWGVPKRYKIGLAVSATCWEEVSEKKKNLVERKSSTIAKKIKRRNGKVKPGFKTKAFFFIMHLLQKNGWNEADVKYWHEKGWTEKNRPWKK